MVKSSGKSYLSYAKREKQIVEKAVEYFSEYGFQASTREIAKHVGVTQPLLYRYFKTKGDLIDRVYQEIFLNRWRGEWQSDLQDRNVLFRDRLKRYLAEYCTSILDREWIRLFLLGAFADQTINKRYLAMLQERTFPIILTELYASIGIVSSDERDRALDNEILWSFHSSFFYIGVRKYVYQLTVPENLDEVIDVKVDAFLDGVTTEFIARRKHAEPVGKVLAKPRGKKVEAS